MNQEKRFSVKRGIEGCLVSLICIMVLMLSISLVLSEWLQLISTDTERIIALFVWLFAICVGGYVAARQGRTTGWTNSLVVGVFGVLFMAAQLANRVPNKTYWDAFLEVMSDPGAHWRVFVALALTIPVAVLGGIVWEKTRRLDRLGDNEQSEPASEAEPQD